MRTEQLLELLPRLPKTDLHLHLDGSLRLETLIQLARERDIDLPSFTTEGLNELIFKPHYASLGEYLQGFAYTCAVLADEAAFEQVARELVEDNLAEGVRYIEVRFAPQLHMRHGLTIEQILAAVERGLCAGATAHNATDAVRTGEDLPFHYGIIVCAMRNFAPGMSDYYSRLHSVLEGMPTKDIVGVASAELARQAIAIRDRLGIPIVGFDLAGEEAGFPAAYHTEAYRFVHRHFMKKTVHAGEAYGPESIFQALTECHADRIGHGTFLFSAETISDPQITDRQRYIEALAEYVASQRIMIEVCLTSNLQTTPSIGDCQSHPMREMLDHRMAISICTDNRLVSHTTVTDELRLAVEAFQLSPERLREILLAGFKGGFFAHGYRAKRAFVRAAMEHISQGLGLVPNR